LGLQEVTALMAGDDLEASADGEADSRNQWIAKANAVDVLGASFDDQFAAGLIAGKESVNYG
jgi:hypothetical protein